MTCTTCSTTIHPLEVFPGQVCLPCWAASPQGSKIPTAEEVIALWGGKP